LAATPNAIASNSITKYCIVFIFYSASSCRKPIRRKPITAVKKEIEGCVGGARQKKKRRPGPLRDNL